jgi:hypothetical protein
MTQVDHGPYSGGTQQGDADMEERQAGQPSQG